ncbi:MAG: hypothetical protein JWM80_3303 [Cyanobacteria bacterium RYN_339]|nr:hypothetical protein [Cyanobacteria bacterium RYN_339]
MTRDQIKECVLIAVDGVILKGMTYTYQQLRNITAQVGAEIGYLENVHYDPHFSEDDTPVANDVIRELADLGLIRPPVDSLT